MKKAVKKEAAAIVITLAALASTICLLTAVLTPKRYDFGSTWGRYLKEDKNSIDVMFFGSSIVYCDVAPAVIWKYSGLSAYVMAGPEQTIPISYYYIKEAVRTQNPKIIFLELTGVFFDKYQNYTKVNIGYMPWGKNRIEATFKAAEPSERAGLLFPLFNYHSRWSSITPGDIKVALLGYERDMLAGYAFVSGYTEMTSTGLREVTQSGETYAENIDYLKKIIAFCEKESIMLCFYIAPTYSRLPDEHLSRLKSDLSELGGVIFVDFTYETDGLDLDGRTDYFDPLHFNRQGAEKFSKHLAALLVDRFAVRSAGDFDAELWQKRYEAFESLK